MTDKQYKCIASQMWFEASRKRTKHEPLAGTYKPFYLGGRISESDGYQLYLAERPRYVYQCSTGKLIAHTLTGLGQEPYWCENPHKQVNHWKFCKPNTVIKNSNYEHLLGN